MPEKAVKRRKPKALRKEDQIRVLVTETEKDELTAAANRAGLPVASWLRSVGLQAARRHEGTAHRRQAAEAHAMKILASYDLIEVDPRTGKWRYITDGASIFDPPHAKKLSE
jgi:hypothetical protein